MIDLHCHMLPGIDDGAGDLDAALTMARMAVEDGIRVTACTPHIYAGLYENTGPGIKQAVEALQTQLIEAEIPLRITYGADTHLAPDLISGLRNGEMPSLPAWDNLTRSKSRRSGRWFTRLFRGGNI